MIKTFTKAIAFIFLTLLIILSTAFGVFAEEDVAETDVASGYEAFISKIEAYAQTGFDVNCTYTSDSVHSYGIMLEPYTDSIKLEAGFVIRTSDLGIGILIYDDPATPIIEGVRVNGKEITSYVVPIDLDNPQNYNVEIKLAYAEGLLGTIAKISDGKFDWETILQEPLIYTQAIYYIIAALSLIIGGLGAASAKKKKVKTADEIASAVDTRVREGCETFAVAYSAVLKENLLPVFQTTVETNKAVVKALTLSTSKSKEAPVALLDLLKEVSDVDVGRIIDDAREQVVKNIEHTDAKRAAVREALSHIADGTYQEVHHVETETETTADERLDETPEKSVF